MIFYWKDEYREDRIVLSVTGPAVRYGFGFFETLYWDGARTARLEMHLARLFGSLMAFGLAFQEEDFEEVISQVAHKNGLTGRTARINIQYPVDEPGAVRAIVTVAPYSPPSRALSLALSPRPLHFWLGLHKSTNHLTYHLEHQGALASGLDGTVLATPCGHLLEAAHAALLFSDGDRFLTPSPPGQGPEAPGLLPSTALAAASEALSITARPIRVDEINGFQQAWALNSLLGMQPLAAIGQWEFSPDAETATRVTAIIHNA
ncbi:MAG: aminotransferase class IV [Proteobacteria bacterium]|nr:aminotransferase class IV [Pseudomonadota bacterium]